MNTKKWPRITHRSYGGNEKQKQIIKNIKQIKLTAALNIAQHGHDETDTSMNREIFEILNVEGYHDPFIKKR